MKTSHLIMMLLIAAAGGFGLNETLRKPAPYNPPTLIPFAVHDTVRVPEIKYRNAPATGIDSSEYWKARADSAVALIPDITSRLYPFEIEQRRATYYLKVKAYPIERSFDIDIVVYPIPYDRLIMVPINVDSLVQLRIEELKPPWYEKPAYFLAGAASYMVLKSTLFKD